MSKLPLYSSDEIINALGRGGFEIARKSKGSHLTMKKLNGNKTKVTVVIQGKKEIPRGTFNNILKLAGLSKEEFQELL